MSLPAEVKNKFIGAESWLFKPVLAQLDRDWINLRAAARQGSAAGQPVKAEVSAAWRSVCHKFFEDALRRSNRLNGELSDEAVRFALDKWIEFLNGVMLDRHGILMEAAASEEMVEENATLGQIYKAYFRKAHADRNVKGVKK
jgi:hypothetical protein